MLRFFLDPVITTRETVQVDKNENTVIEGVGISLKLVVNFKYKVKTFIYQLFCRILQ